MPNEQGEVRRRKKQNASLYFSLFLFSLACLSFFRGSSLFNDCSRFNLRVDFSEEIQTPFRESWRTAKSIRWPRLCRFRSNNTHTRSNIRTRLFLIIRTAGNAYPGFRCRALQKRHLSRLIKAWLCNNE